MPNYPTFDTKRGQMGSYGWGVNKRNLYYNQTKLDPIPKEEFNMEIVTKEPIAKNHLKDLDFNRKNKELAGLPGKFSTNNDNRLKVNHEVFTLMNMSA